jgi:hypothetical protein
MEEKKGNCNECGRELYKHSDFELIEENGEIIIYPCCRWCRAKRTRKLRKRNAQYEDKTK